MCIKKWVQNTSVRLYITVLLVICIHNKCINTSNTYLYYYTNNKSINILYLNLVHKNIYGRLEELENEEIELTSSMVRYFILYSPTIYINYN